MAEQKQQQTVPFAGPGRGPGGRRGPGPMMEREKPKNMRKTLSRLLKYIGASKYIFISLLLVMVFITFLNLAAPTIQGDAIDAITLAAGRAEIDWGRFINMLIWLAVVYAATSLFTYAQGMLSAQLSQSTVRNMRQDLFGRMVKLPIKYFDTHRHGDIMSRMTNDVENISNTISQSIGSLISGGLTVIGTLAIMLLKSPVLTLVSMITLVLTIGATTFMSKFMRKFFTRQQVLLGQINGHAEETVTGYKTIVAFSEENRQIERFNSISEELKSCAIKANVIGGCMGPIMNVISNIGFLLIAGAGGYLALKGAISIGVIQAFLIYSKQFSRPINEIANQYAQIQTAVAGAERVFALMDAEPETDEGKTAAGDVRGDINFEHIVFSYKEGEPVLKDFTLDVKAGQKIALVGATGSGKTTVVNLLTRFYDVDSGRILLDGVDIRDIPKDELRGNIAIVLQDTVLFSDSIASNIRYGRLDASDEDIKAAANTANADIFIGRLAEGYNTHLTESGGNLSQGERQLLSIARAVLADPKILILDEATSSVDTRTEMHIQQAMIALMKNRTSIIIAHRLSTIRDADIIVVLDGGHIAEAGSHDELLEKRGCYYRLYQNQFAGQQT